MNINSFLQRRQTKWHSSKGVTGAVLGAALQRFFIALFCDFLCSLNVSEKNRYTGFLAVNVTVSDNVGMMLIFFLEKNEMKSSQTFWPKTINV